MVRIKISKFNIIKISTSVRDSQDINWPQSIKFSNYHSPLYLRVKNDQTICVDDLSALL